MPAFPAVAALTSVELSFDSQLSSKKIVNKLSASLRLLNILGYFTHDIDNNSCQLGLVSTSLQEHMDVICDKVR